MKEQRSEEAKRLEKARKAAEEREKWWDFAKSQFGDAGSGSGQAAEAADRAAAVKTKTGTAVVPHLIRPRPLFWALNSRRASRWCVTDRFD